KDGKFRPVSNGNYDITITSTDYLGNVGDYSYVVSVASGDKPVFIDQPILPKYIVSGKEYKLEKYFAYNYTDGSGDKISTTVTYTDGMGEKNAKADKIKPIVKTSGDLVIIKYSATLNGNTESVEYGIPVLILRDENGVLEVKDLFVAENGGYTEVDNSGVMLNFSKASVFGFVNPVAADNLDVRFCGTTDKIFYSKISFTISDFIDPSQSVKLNYIKTATGTRFYFNDNDGLTYACENDVFKNSNFITFNYNNNTMKFKYDKTKNSVGTAKEYCNGGSFAGFSSGLVYFTISVEDVTRVSSLTICSINGKTLMDEEYDYIGPRILFGSDYGGNVQINSVITAPSAKGVDIIDGVCDVKLTVKDVNGEFCYDVNGTLLNKVPADRDYLITADKYGTYTMSYYSEDADTNKTNFSFKVSVIDEEKPEIRVTGLPTEGKVGEKVIVPNATAIDNIDSDLTVITYFITPDGILYKLNTNAFIPKSVGKYIIRYSVRDRAGNLTIKDCPIVVK
ncbi:MAG: hypothetical protein J5697_00075, partial [Clostridia bacterium]|nr:hypothetical protein [Clostridia bacterium]